MPPALTCALLLVGSNVFMTFAWYGHLRHVQTWPWWTAAVISLYLSLGVTT